MSESVTVGIRVDPACPWCWLTARWLSEVEQVRPLVAEYRLFSLGIVNARDGDDPERQARLAPLVHAMRLLVVVRRAGGQQSMRRAYTAIGEAVHEHGESLGDGTLLQRCLDTAGFNSELVRGALDDPTTLEELQAEHAEAAARGVFGVPTLELDGCAPMFGPVVETHLLGEQAGELWDHTAWMLRNPHVFELKRYPRPEPELVGRRQRTRQPLSTRAR